MTPVAPPADPGTALLPEIKTNGEGLPTRYLDELVEARIQVAVGTIGRCTLRFRDPDYALAGTSLLRVGVKIEIVGRSIQGGRPLAMFTGKVTSVGYEQRKGQSVDLVVVAEDAAHLLSRNARAVTYLNQSYSDVVQTIVKKAGIAVNVAATTGRHEYLLQSDTDLQFIDEIARRIGWDWVVDHEGEFQFWSSWSSTGRTVALGPTVRATAGESLESFSVKVWSDGVLTARVRGWDHLEKASVAGTAKGVPDVPADLRSAVGLKGADPATVLDARSNPVDQAEAQQIANARSRGVGTVSVRGRMIGVADMRPGVMVKLDGVGPAAGEYFVHEVRHVLTRDGLFTEFVAGDRESYGLGTGAGGPETSSFAHQGLVIAVVTNVKDPEDLGRVKVKFDGLDEAIESAWARVATDSGGPDRGAVFIPSVNDQVLVGFESGDARRPVVLGGLFSRRDKIPAGTVVDGVVETLRVRSRTGHLIELSDGTEEAKNHILLHHASKDHRLRLGKDAATLEVPSGVPITLKSGDASITLDNSGNITIDGKNITLKAQQDVTIDGNNVKIKAKMNAELTGTNIKVKGSASTAVEASGTTTVKGGMVQIN